MSTKKLEKFQSFIELKTLIDSHTNVELMGKKANKYSKESEN